MQTVQWISLRRVMERRDRSRSSTLRDIENKQITPAIATDNGSKAWPSHEIDMIDRARLAGATTDDIALLVDHLVAQRSTFGKEDAVVDIQELLARLRATAAQKLSASS